MVFGREKKMILSRQPIHSKLIGRDYTHAHRFGTFGHHCVHGFSCEKNYNLAIQGVKKIAVIRCILKSVNAVCLSENVLKIIFVV